MYAFDIAAEDRRLRKEWPPDFFLLERHARGEALAEQLAFEREVRVARSSADPLPSFAEAAEAVGGCGAGGAGGCGGGCEEGGCGCGTSHDQMSNLAQEAEDCGCVRGGCACGSGCVGAAGAVGHLERVAVFEGAQPQLPLAGRGDRRAARKRGGGARGEGLYGFDDPIVGTGWQVHGDRGRAPCNRTLLQEQAPHGRVKDDPCMKGFGTCGGSPCVDPEECDLSKRDLDEADKGISFGEVFGIGRASDDEKALLIEALAHLQQHADLIEYACCLSYGRNADACACLMDHISGRKRIEIRAGGTGGSCDPDGEGAVAYVKRTRNRITFCSSALDHALELFNGGQRRRRCAALWIAETLLHELVHVCDPKESCHQEDEDDWRKCNAGPCDEAYDIAGLVEAGMQARCPGDCWSLI